MKLMSVTELSKRWQCSRTWIQTLINKKQIPYKVLASCGYLVDVDDPLFQAYEQLMEKRVKTAKAVEKIELFLTKNL